MKNEHNVAKFDRNTPFNDLPILPPSREIEDDPEILKKLVKASRALAAVNANILRLPNPEMLTNTIGLQEAKASTAIENIVATDDELYKALADPAGDGRSNPAAKDVLRYKEALLGGYDMLAQQHTVNLDLITRIFQRLKNTSAGLRPSGSMVAIRRGDGGPNPGEVIYTPPRGGGVIEGLMDNLTGYLNDDEKYDTDPLLKMCIAHYQFEAIHPFQDGNGRSGRILNLLYLVNKKLLSRPVLYLSRYILLNRDDYYHNLAAVTQRAAWKNWILYILEAVERTSVLTNDLIDQIVTQMAMTLGHGRTNIKWYNKEINEALFSQPYSRPKVIGKLLNKTSRTTLTKYMDELTGAGILSSRKEGKEVYYVNNDLIRILGR